MVVPQKTCENLETAPVKSLFYLDLRFENVAEVPIA